MVMMVTMVMIPDGHNGPLAPLEEEDEKKKKNAKKTMTLIVDRWANWLVDDADNEGDDGDDDDDDGWWMTGDGRWTMDEGW